MAETHALWEYDWDNQSDFLLDLASSVTGHSLTEEKSMYSNKYLPPHRLTPVASGSTTVEAVTSMAPVVTQKAPPAVSLPQTPTPVTKCRVASTNTETESPHRAPLYSNKSCIFARNNTTSLMCGCTGCFFWELIPADNINYFRGHVPDSVDHCISSINLYDTFSDAFWDAYNNCITNPGTDLSLFNRDYCIGVYQMHQDVHCPRGFTRFTLTSVKSFLLYNESLKAHPVVNTFCMCNAPGPVKPSEIPYKICYNCLQCTMEIRAIAPIGILEHFSYECNFKVNFLTALQKGVQNRSVYFLAQSLFEAKNSVTKPIAGKNAYLSFWVIKGRRHTEMLKLCINPSLCIMCARCGNGFTTFLCSTCSKKKLLQK